MVSFRCAAGKPALMRFRTLPVHSLVGDVRLTDPTFLVNDREDSDLCACYEVWLVVQNWNTKIFLTQCAARFKISIFKTI